MQQDQQRYIYNLIRPFECAEFEWTITKLLEFTDIKRSIWLPPPPCFSFTWLHDWMTHVDSRNVTWSLTPSFHLHFLQRCAGPRMLARSAINQIKLWWVQWTLGIVSCCLYHSVLYTWKRGMMPNLDLTSRLCSVHLTTLSEQRIMCTIHWADSGNLLTSFPWLKVQVALTAFGNSHPPTPVGMVPPSMMLSLAVAWRRQG